jgi:hypothetical protein
MIYEQKPSLFVSLDICNRGIRFLFYGVGVSGEGSNSLGLGCLGHAAWIKHIWDFFS